ncbi:hypothetical protein ACFLY0_00335 [Patescibacteria group bacterium]
MINEKTLQEDAMSEILLEQYKKLPKALQEAIVSVETSKTIQEIGKKHNLHVDQMGELIDETWLALLGIVKSADFVDDLRIRLEVDGQKAGEIASDVNEQIFNKVKSALVEAEKISEEGIVEQTLQSAEEEGDVPPSRENILVEIEDDVEPEESTQPTTQPIPTTPKGELAGQEIGQEPVEAPEAAQNLMEGKLGGEFKVPSTETEQIVEQKEESAEAPASEKKIDPYREAVE